VIKIDDNNCRIRRVLPWPRWGRSTAVCLARAIGQTSLAISPASWR